MASTYTFDVFSSLDGFGAADSSANWTGYWGKQVTGDREIRALRAWLSSRVATTVAPEAPGSTLRGWLA